MGHRPWTPPPEPEPDWARRFVQPEPLSTPWQEHCCEDPAAVKAFARLDGIVTLVDAKHIEQHLDEEKPEGAENEAVEQVAFADRLLLNKTDLVTEEDLARIEARLRGINAFAPIQRCTRGTVSVESVLDVRGFDLQRALQVHPQS